MGIPSICFDLTLFTAQIEHAATLDFCTEVDGSGICEGLIMGVCLAYDQRALRLALIIDVRMVPLSQLLPED